MDIVVWFSCGSASAVALKKTLELFPNDNVRAVYNPVTNEHKDNLRFLKDIENWCGIKIEIAKNPKFELCDINEVFRSRKYMSGVSGAPCTQELKKNARYNFEKNNKIDFHVLGFTHDEIHRHEKFVKTERENVLPVLIDLKLTKNDCFELLKNNGIKLPEIYSFGFKNANCIGCVKATSPSYWDLVRENFPDIFLERAKLSREIGCKLTRYHGKRIFLDELPDKIIRKPIRRSPDCGIFCEEK